MNKICKYCIHYDVCLLHEDNFIDDANKNGFCGKHKSKSRYIELPCAVGDAVYFIDTCKTAEDYGKKFINSSRVKRISVDNEFAILYDHSIILFENTYRTKEDAEKVLKGGVEE